MNLPININDLLTARTVEWERVEFKAGWKDMCEFRFLARRYRNRRVGEFLKELEVNDHPQSGWLEFSAIGRKGKSTSVL